MNHQIVAKLIKHASHIPANFLLDHPSLTVYDTNGSNLLETSASHRTLVAEVHTMERRVHRLERMLNRSWWDCLKYTLFRDDDDERSERPTRGQEKILSLEIAKLIGLTADDITLNVDNQDEICQYLNDPNIGLTPHVADTGIIGGDDDHLISIDGSSIGLIARKDAIAIINNTVDKRTMKID